MEPYPLKHLNFYLVKKDFESGLVGNKQTFKKDTLIQYQSSISDIHGMDEVIQFKDHNTSAILVWRIRVEELYEHWNEYLSPIANPFI
jgi:hypothetical protein